jgi:Flp pilus assembly protein TadG
MRILNLLRDCRGATTIEYAMILPIMIWLAFGTLEFSVAYYSSSVLEGAVTFSSRLAKTGYSETDTTGQSREDMIREMIAAQASTLMDPDKVTIETRVYGNLGNINQPEPYIDGNSNNSYDSGESYSDINGNGLWDTDMGSAGVGGADDIVVYIVTYPWQVMTPFLRETIGTDGIITLQTSVVVKNEPWETDVFGG